MSRTFRRKNYERAQGDSWSRSGDKIAGYYTKREYVRTSHGWAWTYRAPTEHEKNKQWVRVHADHGGANEWSPGWWYRNSRMRQNRSITRQELHRWTRDADYEPMVEEEPRSCLWDWR